MTYGASAQKNTAQFAESVLVNVSSKDLGEISTMLTGLVGELKKFSEPDKQKTSIFRKASGKVDTFKARYNTVEQNIDRIVGQLENHRFQMLKDIALFDQMYQKNLEYLKEVTFYIIAGKRKLDEVENGELRKLRDSALKSGTIEEAQKANALADLCNRFDRKLYDLELTRVIALQTGPQIRMVQSADMALSEKIQSTIVNTIPLWKNQIVLTLGLAHTQNALSAQREVTEMTNALLKKNAEMLKSGVVGTAREVERGIVDIETLKSTNQSLISALDEVTKIQEEGRQKRRDAEQEIASIESEMRQKLLEMNSVRQ
jgi:uncharacterized protein YaaN involved in tellurite resistance